MLRKDQKNAITVCPWLHIIHNPERKVVKQFPFSFTILSYRGIPSSQDESFMEPTLA